MDVTRSRFDPRSPAVTFLAIVAGASLVVGYVIVISPRGGTSPVTTLSADFCPLVSIPNSTYHLQESTPSPNCYAIKPPTGSTTTFVWQTLGGNASMELWRVCIPSADCMTGIAGDTQIYNATASFGSGTFANPRGLAFEFSAWIAPAGQNVTVLIAGSWS